MTWFPRALAPRCKLTSTMPDSIEHQRAAITERLRDARILTPELARAIAEADREKLAAFRAAFARALGEEAQNS